MGRGWKIALGFLVALAVGLGANAAVTDMETRGAEVTVPDGRIVDLPGGDLQVLDIGPRGDPAPIVLIHCFTCGIDWWDRMLPLLSSRHRVVAVDLLGHDGSEKPSSGYWIPVQAALVAGALEELEVSNAEVVGHSLGGPVSVALAEGAPDLVSRLVIIDTIPDNSYGDVGFVGELPFVPVFGEALWTSKPDAAIRDGLEIAFAPGFEVPDEFVEDVKRMTYKAYVESHNAFDHYTGAESVPERIAATGKPALAIMGAEERLAKDPRAALAAYRQDAPGTQTILIAGAGHSPNVEKPAKTAGLVLDFGRELGRQIGDSPANTGKR